MVVPFTTEKNLSVRFERKGTGTMGDNGLYVGLSKGKMEGWWCGTILRCDRMAVWGRSGSSDDGCVGPFRHKERWSCGTVSKDKGWLA